MSPEQKVNSSMYADVGPAATPRHLRLVAPLPASSADSPDFAADRDHNRHASIWPDFVSVPIVPPTELGATWCVDDDTYVEAHGRRILLRCVDVDGVETTVHLQDGVIDELVAAIVSAQMHRCPAHD
ncbi:hypothetical protein [Rhodococcus sp. W8901]|uniref:hypothetical protein n=1 Tax=Rhodococcus sp. W8901 TaxID=2742603 RepID=UPI001582BA95|nr:hypothetical protein [Rhodococcus sp. W8901]QKT11718.1 hypothetical protein HUN07_14175 [Rhodococcus sp. W8901]